jgi:membrane-associated phospholipid phosphatase
VTGVARERGRSPALDELGRRRVVAFLVIAVLAAVGVILLYVFTVRTHTGRTIDAVAYEGRHAVRPRATKATNDLLRTITTGSLAFLGGALFLVALARGRWRLALAVVGAIGASVLTSEVLKDWVFTRPIHDVGGIPFNTYPSGHATIGMALSLGLVVVVAHHWRWLASIVAAFVATLFGTSVLTSGWHRPGDAFGAYLVALAWFSVAMAILVAWRGRGDPERLRQDVIEERANPTVTLFAGLLLVGAFVFTLALTIEKGSIRTVPYTLDYIAMVTFIDAAGVAVVGVFHLLMRDVSPDPPPAWQAPSPGPDPAALSSS